MSTIIISSIDNVSINGTKVGTIADAFASKDATPAEVYAALEVFHNKAVSAAGKTIDAETLKTATDKAASDATDAANNALEASHSQIAAALTTATQALTTARMPAKQKRLAAAQARLAAAQTEVASIQT